MIFPPIISDYTSFGSPTKKPGPIKRIRQLEKALDEKKPLIAKVVLMRDSIFKLGNESILVKEAYNYFFRKYISQNIDNSTVARKFNIIRRAYFRRMRKEKNSRFKYTKDENKIKKAENVIVASESGKLPPYNFASESRKLPPYNLANINL